jgi:hypothetical protein
MNGPKLPLSFDLVLHGGSTEADPIACIQVHTTAP